MVWPVQAAQVRKTSFIPRGVHGATSRTAYDPDMHQSCTVFAKICVQQVRLCCLGMLASQCLFFFLFLFLLFTLGPSCSG